MRILNIYLYKTFSIKLDCMLNRISITFINHDEDEFTEKDCEQVSVSMKEPITYEDTAKMFESFAEYFRDHKPV